MIAAPVECDVDGVAEGLHGLRLPRAYGAKGIKS